MICQKCNSEYSSPYCTSIPCLTFEITKVEEPEQGYLTYVDGYKYPLRALPHQQRLDAVALEKRAIIATLRLGFRLLKSWTPNRILHAVIQWLSELYEADYGNQLKLPIERYSVGGREIQRALEKVNPFKETAWITLLGIIGDTDLAYHNRQQDLFTQIHKEDLIKNPRKEVLRIIDLGMGREVAEYSDERDITQVGKMKMVRRFMSIALLTKPVKELITNFFLELDLKKLEISIEDRYWMANRFDYNYEGKTYKERKVWKDSEDKDYVKPVKEPQKPNIYLMPPNQAFYDLSEQEAEEMAEKTKQALIQNYLQTKGIL